MKKAQQPLQMKNKRKTPIDTEHKNENFRSKHNVLFLYLIADPFSFVFCQRDRGLCGVTRSFMDAAARDVFARVISRDIRVNGTPWSPRGSREGNENILLPEPTHEHTYLTPDQITSRSFSKAHCLFDNLFHWTFIFGIRRPTFAKTMETLMFDMLSDCFLLPKN